MQKFTVGFGELLNFTAYAFAPASLVTPLGVLSVLVTSVLASYYLHEKLNLLGKFGCLLCILGSTVIVIHCPKEENINTLEELVVKLQKPLFIFYSIAIILICLYLNIFVTHKHGHKNISLYIFLCSAIGSLSVMFCKALGVACKEIFAGNNKNVSVFSPLVLFFVFMIISCITFQMNYLNRALDIFNTSIVTPIYYVMFTTFVVIASTILFEEWNQLAIFDIIGNICGFLTVIVGIVLLNTFKDIDISLSSVRHVLRPKRESVPQYENELIT